MGRAYEGITDLLDGGPRTFRCPAHEDDRESLSVGIGESDDKAIVHCFAGCNWKSVLAALGLPASAIYDDWRKWEGLALARAGEATPTRRAPVRPKRSSIDILGALDAGCRRMTDELAAELWRTRAWSPEVVRRAKIGADIDANRVLIPARDAAGMLVGLSRYWFDTATREAGTTKLIALPGSQRELFPRPEAFSVVEPIVIVEGEPDALAVASLGLQAVGIPGAASWKPEWALRFADRRVVVLIDSDAAGDALAARVVSDLIAARASVTWLQLPSGRDATDLILSCRSGGSDALMTLGRLPQKVLR